MEGKNNNLRDNKHFLLEAETIVSWGCRLEIHIGNQRQIALLNNIVFKADKGVAMKIVYDARNSATVSDMFVRFFFNGN